MAKRRITKKEREVLLERLKMARAAKKRKRR